MNNQPNGQPTKKLALKKQSIVVLSAPPRRTALPNLELLNQVQRQIANFTPIAAC